MTSANGIEAIFFDLGMVLVTFDWERAIAKWAGEGDTARWREFMTDARHDEFERGEATEAEFFEYVGSVMKFGGSAEAFREQWNGIFTDIPSSIELVRRLAKHYPLYALSNTNPWHAAYLEEHAEWMSLFTERFYSFELGVRKPDVRIYEMALERVGVAAEHALFLDDKLENVEAAERVGMVARHVPTPESLANQLAGVFPEILSEAQVGTAELMTMRP